MNAFKLNIFPTQLFVFDFDDKDIEPVVKETIKLESQIKICNYLTPENVCLVMVIQIGQIQ